MNYRSSITGTGASTTKSSGAPELTAISALLQSLVGTRVDGTVKGKGKGRRRGAAAIDAQALQALLGQLKDGAGDLPRALQDAVGDLLGQVDDGIDQLPMPAK